MSIWWATRSDLTMCFLTKKRVGGFYKRPKNLNKLLLVSKKSYIFCCNRFDFLYLFFVWKCVKNHKGHRGRWGAIGGRWGAVGGRWGAIRGSRGPLGAIRGRMAPGEQLSGRYCNFVEELEMQHMSWNWRMKKRKMKFF